MICLNKIDFFNNQNTICFGNYTDPPLAVFAVFKPQMFGVWSELASPMTVSVLNITVL